MPDYIDQFREAIRATGLKPPDRILDDGRKHRFSSNGKHNDDGAEYCLYGNGIPAGYIKDYRTDFFQTWRADLGRTLTPDEEEDNRIRLKELRQRHEAEMAKRRKDAADKAAAIWKKASPAKADHPYLVRKAVEPVATLREITAEAAAAVLNYAPKVRGQALAGRLLVVPVMLNGKLSTLELIDETGLKSALAGGAKAGGYWAAQLLPDGDGTGLRLLIGEGVATMLTATAASGCPAVAALCCSNLGAVAQQLRERYPAAEIVILSDLGNGQPDAVVAARTVAGRLVVPNFGSDPPEGATDFNDMAAVRSLEAVGQAIAAAKEVSKGSAAPSAEVVPGGRSGTVSDLWPNPQPIEAELQPVPSFEADALLPTVLQDWIMDEADRMPCPPDFIAAGAVVALGSIIGARCAIKPKSRDDWLVVPNLWGGIVGLPSAKKSPAIGVALKSIDRLAALAAEALQVDQSAFEADRIIFKARKDAIEQQIKTKAKGGNGRGADLEALKAELQVLQQQEPTTPIQRRYKSNDSTVEKLGELLKENPAGLLVVRDELVGLLASWDKQGHEGDRAFFLEAWNGTAGFDTDRIGRGSISIPNLCLSLFGGIQPDKLTGYLEQTARSLANDGMLQRFQVLVYPDPRPWEWRDHPPNRVSRDRAHAVFETLADFDPVTWGAAPADDFNKFPHFRFDEGAQAVFINWSTDLHRNKLPAEENPLINQHLTKYDKLFPALALILHLVDCAAEGQRGPVSRAAALRAAAWCEYLEGHARRCYGLLADEGLRAAQALAGRLRQGRLTDGFTARDVRRNQWRYLTEDRAVQAALDWLEGEGWLRGVEDSHGGPGRRTCRYTINPKIGRAGGQHG